MYGGNGNLYIYMYISHVVDPPSRANVHRQKSIVLTVCQFKLSEINEAEGREGKDAVAAEERRKEEVRGEREKRRWKECGGEWFVKMICPAV